MDNRRIGIDRLILYVAAGLSALVAILDLFGLLSAVPWLQQFINRHRKSIPPNDEKVLRQLGNAFGGLGALITAIIQLI